MKDATIIYTKIDEAPALATYSLLPVIKAYVKGAGISIETKDISLAGRILANFPENLSESQKIPDYLGELGELTQKPEANIIKLPNISASVPQLKAAIKELQSHGYDIPDYPEEPATDEEKDIHQRYAKVLGSAVNPVLRQGNSDRRAPESVKEYAKKYPRSMGLPLREWAPGSKSHVAHMEDGDFYGNEKSVVSEKDDSLTIVFTDAEGNTTVLKEGVKVLKGEIVDGTFMSIKALREFFSEQIIDAKKQGILFSLHMKATMMKVSDPVIFGHCVSVYYTDVLEKHAGTLKELGVNVNNGIGDLYARIQKLPDDKRKEIENDIEAVYTQQPGLAMVDSSKGITNLHVPSDIIIDASMPVVVRDGGRMWGADDQLHDAKAVIPDRSYATIYKEIVEDCKKHGAFDRSQLGTVPNVGLMAQKAEEYGSHLTTFESPGNGKISVKDSTGAMLMEHEVEKGDIWRMSRVRDIPVRDWVKLAVARMRATGTPGVFWLDQNRAHDAQLISKIELYMKDHDTSGLDYHIMAPQDAMKFTLERIRKGEDTISITGNVLRDYLTDLFPIIELGTSAKMLSIVPLLNGGGLFETGAGGSAPKHVQQFVKENHLRWDSLGEYSALMASFEHIETVCDNKKAGVLKETLDSAISKFLENEKSPSRKVGELDNRGSNFYIALYWAQSLAEQSKDTELQKRFQQIASELEANEAEIVKELNEAQGNPVDMGGYYDPDPEILERELRPSKIFNSIIDGM
ncbi:MAG TPA: NADP-dependent isocitrate dehydrogenase [Spirochaetota bacterium]|nr:NADP-dependent isocitrate dehydrogenase [Spirochaetota bacterium]